MSERVLNSVISSKVISLLRNAAEEYGNPLPYDLFVKIALYDPIYGYYSRPKNRIGRSRETDFYTASSIDLFGELIVAAIQNVCPYPLEAMTFVEIGAEANTSILNHKIHPFKEVISYGIKDRIAIPPLAVVFSNELFDAQPFNRFKVIHKNWREMGVYIDQDRLYEKPLLEFSEKGKQIVAKLPENHFESYTLDYSLDAESLLIDLLRTHWQGLLLIFDYGKSWDELLYATPHGTARSYYRHKIERDLFARVGDCDITYHICWDALDAILKSRGYTSYLRSQESFFMHYAFKKIEEIVSRAPESFDRSRQSLLELIHPAHMGKSFQVLASLIGGL